MDRLRQACRSDVRPIARSSNSSVRPFPDSTVVPAEPLSSESSVTSSSWDEPDESGGDLRHPVLRRLVDVLRSQPGGSASRLLVATVLWGARDGGRSLRRYVQKAVDLGVVEKYFVSTEPWLRLTAPWQISESLLAARTSRGGVIPSKFFPLFAGFAELQSTAVHVEALFAQVERFQALVVFAGSRRERTLNWDAWSSLLEEADKFGIVKVTNEGRWDEDYTKAKLLRTP